MPSHATINQPITSPKHATQAPMLKKTCQLIACAYILLGTCPTAAVAESPKNVVLILADDLGWADTELYGKRRSTRRRTFSDSRLEG